MPKPVFEHPRLEWDGDAIFRAAGGPTPLIRLLEAEGLDAPVLNTAYAWSARGRVPALWMPNILYCLLKNERATVGQLIRRIEPIPDLPRKT